MIIYIYWFYDLQGRHRSKRTRLLSRVFFRSLRLKLLLQPLDDPGCSTTKDPLNDKSDCQIDRGRPWNDARV